MQTARILFTIALIAAVSGCSEAASEQPIPYTSVPPVQVTSAPDEPKLTTQDLDTAVTAALADPSAAQAVQQGKVEKVQVSTDGSGDRIVYFLFTKPVEPKTVPWPTLCDIGDKSKEWRGVAVRITPGENQVSGSPIWLSGNNCVSAKVS